MKLCLKIIIPFIFCILFLPSKSFAQYTDSYTSSYTDSYTSSYTDGYSYTGGYEGGYENGYQGTYQGGYESTYAPQSFLQNTPVPYCSGSTSTISLSWSSYSGAVSYEVFFIDQAAGTLVDNNITTNQLTQNMTSAQGLIIGHQYSFVIAALNSSGGVIAYSDNSLWSHQKFGSYTTFPDCTPPPPPAFSVVTNQCDLNRPGTDKNQITFYFTSGASNILNFYLDRDGAQIASTTPNNPYINIYLSPSEAHQYAARVRTASGTSTTSSPINLTGVSCAAAPPAPTLSVVTNQCVNRPGADDNQITFKFDSSVSYSQTFILYVDGVQNQTTTTGNPYIDLFLTPGETHNFTARAQTASGTSPVSNTVNLVGKDCAVVTPPPAPNLSVVTNQCVSRPGTDDNQITFRFDSAAPNIQSFLLYVDGVYSGSATVANPYIDVFLSPGENHNFTGKVQTTSGLSPSSNSIGLTGACQIPTVNFRIDTLNGVFPAQSFPVNVNQNTYAMLRWDISNGAATSVTANTIPAGIAPYWNGPLNLVSGQALVDTSVPQTIQFYITVSNATGSTGPIGLQLNINKYPGPFIQTTGGGVHTNENIYISQ